MTKKIYTTVTLVLLSVATYAQDTISQWNFNSNPPDANTATGITMPNAGAGTISTVGTVTNLFASGAASGGSSDPAASDNSAYQTTTYPAQGVGDRSHGIQINVSTLGYQDITLSFDVRSSNTASRYLQIQYTTDATASSVIWQDFDTAIASLGDAWVNNRTYDFSSITALNDNPNAAFRIVTRFAPDTNIYYAANPTGTYGGGTLRYDMITIKGSEAAVVVPNVGVQFEGNFITVTEDSSTFAVVAKLLGNHPDPTSVSLSYNPMSTASVGSDFTPVDVIEFSWPANAANTFDTVFFQIVNDSISEETKYAIFNFDNPNNINIPYGNTNIFTVYIQDNDKECVTPVNAGSLQYITSFSNGAAGTNSSEIVDYDSASKRLFIVNSIGGKIDIVDFSNDASPTLLSSVTINPTYGNINSLAVRNGVVAAAVENLDPQANGSVVFFDTDGTFIHSVTVGAMPDMITFSPDGTKVLTANEGEPNAAYTIDPEGTISIIDISAGIASATANTVTFNSFNNDTTALRAAGVRIFGPGATVAQDLEPEYITFSTSGDTAFVACQENNAIAILDMVSQEITAIRPLGAKDHSISGNGLDANDQTGKIHIATWPLKGLYMPDAISSFSTGGVEYIITANEGDAREYTGYSEITRLSSAAYPLDTTVFPNHLEIKKNLGRINVTKASGDTDGDGLYDEIHTFGSRSLSIWNAATGELVWDSGDKLEQMIACHPVWSALFNASNSNNSFKNRSDDKGPEPEGVTVKSIGGQIFAFATLERIGGVVVYNVTNPSEPLLVDYLNTRNTASYGGDNGAEGILVFPKPTAPITILANPEYYVIAANEVSSTLAIYNFSVPDPLPITLGEFNGYYAQGKDHLEWTMNVKNNGNTCSVEMSDNGLIYKNIGTVDCSENVSNYSYENEVNIHGKRYYRLKITNEDNSYYYSKVVVLNSDENLSLSIYPNPANDKIYIDNNFNEYYQIIDIQGNVLSKGSLKIGLNEINISTIPTGIYIIQATNAKGHAAHEQLIIK